jgi:hypothetical protein
MLPELGVAPRSERLGVDNPPPENPNAGIPPPKNPCPGERRAFKREQVSLALGFAQNVRADRPWRLDYFLWNQRLTRELLDLKWPWRLDMRPERRARREINHFQVPATLITAK